jgi:hypothetical protein
MDWTSLLVHSWFFWYLFAALLAATYIYEYRIRSASNSASRRLMFYYVLAVALCASIGVLCAKVLTVFGKAVYSSSSSSATTANPDSGNLAPTHIVLGMVISFLAMSILSQEILRQKAISQFPVSQFHPVTYATFNALCILVSAIVFRELSDDLRSYAIFLLTYVLGIGAIVAGSKKLAFSSDDVLDASLQTKLQ